MGSFFDVFREASSFIIACYNALPDIIQAFFEFIVIWFCIWTGVHMLFNLR